MISRINYVKLNLITERNMLKTMQIIYEKEIRRLSPKPLRSPITDDFKISTFLGTDLEQCARLLEIQRKLQIQRTVVKDLENTWKGMASELEEVTNKMEPREAKAFMLRHIQGRKLQDIANTMNYSRMQVIRILKKAEKKLEDVTQMLP